MAVKEPKVSFTVSVPVDVPSILQGAVDRQQARDRSDAVTVLVRYAQQIMDLQAKGYKLVTPDHKA